MRVSGTLIKGAGMSEVEVDALDALLLVLKEEGLGAPFRFEGFGMFAI